MNSPPKAPSEEPDWIEALNQLCPICGKRKGDHLVDEYVECIRKRVEMLRHSLQ